MKRYLLVALVVALLPLAASAQMAGPPIAPGSLRLEPAPYGHNVTWVATERADGWTVYRNGTFHHRLTVGLPVGEVARAPVFDYSPGDAFQVCATQGAVTRCQTVRSHWVMLPLLHH